MRFLIRRTPGRVTHIFALPTLGRLVKRDKQIVLALLDTVRMALWRWTIRSIGHASSVQRDISALVVGKPNAVNLSRAYLEARRKLTASACKATNMWRGFALSAVSPNLGTTACWMKNSQRLQV